MVAYVRVAPVLLAALVDKPEIRGVKVEGLNRGYLMGRAVLGVSVGRLIQALPCAVQFAQAL
jgi:hypothetical protein